ncbi:MAG: non-hydrolyzing UDP-N-acetylglucosamine 2-epimerase [bacterium]
MKFLNVVGARPNFMKIAPLQRELDRKGYERVLVHTGQHYDEEMSEQFYEDLGMSPPDYNLAVGSDTQAAQTARVMERIEPVIDDEDPDWVIVVGDVNSTLAAGLVAAKKSSNLAHIEAGIRSGNREMPEEINRVIVDRISDALFCFDEEAEATLESEGIASDRIHLVGDIMIDSLKYTLDQLNGTVRPDVELPEEYAVLTLHRPSNVDNLPSLEQAFEILKEVNRDLPLVFPIHPRTEESLERHGLLKTWRNEFNLIPPLNYGEFVSLMNNARAVLTDSGSIQQETSVMDVPCLTLRKQTERAVTIRKGTNRLVGMDRDAILSSVEEIKNNNWKTAEDIPLWDGQTARRIVQVFEDLQS